MLNVFVYSFNKSFFKILSSYLGKDYRENISALSLSIQTNEFKKLVNFLNPQKITYESIVFYTKSSEPIKEMVSSDFNILIFNSQEEKKEEISKIKNRDIQIINTYLSSKSILKNPHLKEPIQELSKYVEIFPNFSVEESVMINSRYHEVINLLSLISVKKNLIVLDSDKMNIDELVISYPLSILAEIIDLPEEEVSGFLELYSLGNNLKEKITEFVALIRERILKHWVIFYTGNKREAKQYLVPLNTNVLAASSKIHTDFARKFIQAEVCNISEMVDDKLPPFKTHGKNYIVQNHDYLLIRTS
ncbi:MAG: DUF933 domain-containing protein [Candidatus Calescibacterium sp.]|nr:DUF933 domain-containing protein [Candidatus Calescibacterium sp.]MCX7972062.1 DUF933 domain-containing protein [bacterium]MDW8194653.1 DUF933 domain-containing protein [Candidatus Calescibacterium sp.]